MVDGQDKTESPIESLKKRLYGRGKAAPGVGERERLYAAEHDVRADWEREQTPIKTDIPPTAKSRNKRFVKRFLIFSIIFFLLALGVAFFILSGGGNIISSDNVAIEVSGPVSIDGGETLPLVIDVTNNNNTTLQVVDLLVEYPDGTRDALDLSRELPRHRESLGDIKPRAHVSKLVEAVLFGEEGSKKEVKITVEYRVEGSNAIFFKERLYEVEISSAPIVLSVRSPSAVNSGQEVELVLELTTNSRSPIKNVLVHAEYPFGFTFIRATPEPVFDDNVWNFGDIEPEGKRTIRIVGTIEGQDNEERIFRFESGIQSTEDEKRIGTPFITLRSSLVIERPFIGLDLVLNGQSGDEYISESGKTIRADIVWRNNVPAKLADAVIEVELVGSVLDESSVSVTNGSYDSLRNTISWDKRNLKGLELIDAGESGSVSFGFNSLPAEDIVSRGGNPEIVLNTNIKARSLSDDPTLGSVSSSRSRVVRIASDLMLTSRIVYFVGPLTNSGPVPPKAEQETTYTIIWSVTNSSSDVTGAFVRAILPSYVRWVGVVSPSSESVSFNAVGGEIVWDIDEVRAGTGYSGSPQEVAFQVAFTPSVTHVGTTPSIIGASTLTGVDRFTKVTVGDSNGALNTRLSTDPNFKTGDDRVVE